MEGIRDGLLHDLFLHPNRYFAGLFDALMEFKWITEEKEEQMFLEWEWS